MSAPGSPEGPAAGRRVTSGSQPAGLVRHVPVLLQPMLSALAPRDGATYIDATFGAGGYSSAILEAADCRVLALDRDPDAVRAAAQLIANYAGRLTVVEAPFSRIEEQVRAFTAAESKAPAIDGIVLDIGVSSMQIDEATRGFSFMRDGPLDMRMSQSGPSAADVVNETGETELANILYDLGEERRSRAIARAIAARRQERPFQTTADLADLVARVLGGRKGSPVHPATRTFQALRIHVNDELGELEKALEQAERLLAPGGRLVVVTFHSLEDRIVKRFFAERTGRMPSGSRHLPGGLGPESSRDAPRFRFVNPRPLSPSEDELAVNPRARSARLRWAVRTEAPSQE